MYNKKYREEVDVELTHWSLENPKDIIFNLLQHIDNLTEIGNKLAYGYHDYDVAHNKFCTYCLGDDKIPHHEGCAVNNWNKLVDA